ncbi:hypothetical protein SDRG_11370 [Saprolegnia diclina VS20]|uniref:Uncharacterized protein n=1 Tax=Saprolegnia diclina (strain VS20) TaxID=1156394 RepID=T0PZ93_SAPDV|nr:hypothetical protein SDRG_11370 [Saprolegnia diclina VS20]EQC30889.1 hypothetical protein SDRG_11370 [Saprolegnia diclina VS20]|eukprot:XP_008615627.1 hypothetical protein SDRG_11370 [Saprolegnia diclina VS20]
MLRRSCLSGVLVLLTNAIVDATTTTTTPWQCVQLPRGYGAFRYTTGILECKSVRGNCLLSATTGHCNDTLMVLRCTDALPDCVAAANVLATNNSTTETPTNRSAVPLPIPSNTTTLLPNTTTPSTTTREPSTPGPTTADMVATAAAGQSSLDTKSAVCIAVIAALAVVALATAAWKVQRWRQEARRAARTPLPQFTVQHDKANEDSVGPSHVALHSTRMWWEHPTFLNNVFLSGKSSKSSKSSRHGALDTPSSSSRPPVHL